MNLIITPIYKAFKELQECCDALDEGTDAPFFHIIVDDNSGKKPPIKVKENRIIITLDSDVDPNDHQMEMGKCMDLAFDYAMNNLEFENYFHIESDVIMMPHWDTVMFDYIKELPENWGTLDINSVDENGNTTYPNTVHHRTGQYKEEILLDELEFPDFQCTLFSPAVLNLYKTRELRYSRFPSHWDILTGRHLNDLGYRHFRGRRVKGRHYGGAARELLPKR
jgi:hypothetical protein